MNIVIIYMTKIVRHQKGVTCGCLNENATRRVRFVFLVTIEYHSLKGQESVAELKNVGQ